MSLRSASPNGAADTPHRTKTSLHRVLILGGTGVLGRALVPRLIAAGHTVRTASRHTPARVVEGETWWHLDLAIGEGAAAALRGVDVVVHLASSISRTRQVDVAGTRRVLDAARSAGVRHVIYVSITGIDTMPFGYYRAKVEVERLVEHGGIPWTVLRAAQFPEFIAALMELANRLPVMLLPTDFKFQPVHAGLVADRLLQCVQDGPGGRLPDLAGPEVLTVEQMAQAWQAARGSRKPIVHLPLPGALPAAFRAGTVTAPTNPTPGPTWGDWVRDHAREPNVYVARSFDGQLWRKAIVALKGRVVSGPAAGRGART